MAEHRPSDPLVALLSPTSPVAPAPDFSTALRTRLVEALLIGTPEDPMTATPTTPTTPTSIGPALNGRRHGDVSYLTVGVRDAAAARAFYGALFGWTFTPGDPSPRSQVGGVRPQVGMAEGRQPGVVLAFRVDDIAAASTRVRAAGGTATESVQRPYGLESDCTDDQGIPFYLHEFADGPAQPVGPRGPRNGAAHGDVAYVSLGVPDLAAARAFYGAVLGWTFAPGTSEQGNQVEAVAPMTGLWGGGDWTGARLAYRVDDISAAVSQVVALGGTAGPVAARPYGLACDDCADDKGAPFMLLQLGGAD